MSSNYVQHHLALLKYLSDILHSVSDNQMLPPEHQGFLERYAELLALMEQGSDDIYLGQEIISQVFQRYPQIAHQVPRDLLWFFGGECLHYMPDEEIELYQQLEDKRFAALENGEEFDWAAQVKLMFLPASSASH